MVAVSTSPEPPSLLDAVQERKGLLIAYVPHAMALGFTVVDAKVGEAWLKVPFDPKLVGNTATGVIHGGVITALLDGVSGVAVFSAPSDIVPIATLDLRIDYLRPADAGRAVTARATCYKLTRSVAFTRAVAYHDDPGDPIAHSVGTFMVSPSSGGARP